MTENLVCWKCGASIADLPLPLSRRAVCSSCHAELHVCLLCRFFDKTRNNQCREPVAEPVQYKDKANFCAYFQAKPGAWQKADTSAAQTAQGQLADLFGEQTITEKSPADADQSKAELEKLFGMDKSDDDSGQ
ncbi:MAG: hypothetical protein PVJ39_19460 [Gammaproteobacteria bacterium]